MLPGKKFTPPELLGILWGGRWLISGSLLAGTFVALVVSALLPNMYRSEMLIQIVPQRVPDSYVQSTVTMRTEDRLDSLAQQVMSRTQLEHLIQEFDLYGELRSKKPLEDVVEHMRSSINRQLVRPTSNEPADAFYLRFTYPDAKVATVVTSRLGSLFIDQNARDRGELAEATNNFLDAQLQEARARLETQERKLEEFRQRHSGRLPSQLDFNMQAIQSTQLQLQALVESLARDRDRKLILERLHADADAEPSPVPPVLPTSQAAGQVDSSGAPTMLTPQQQLDVAQATLTKLSLRLTPEHPDIVRLKRLIEELESRIKAEPEQPSSPSTARSRTESFQESQRRERLGQMRAELESVDRQIKFKESEELRLRASVADFQSRIAAVPALESEWISLTRDYDTIKDAYQKLLAKSEDSKVAADLERRQIGEQFRILDPARIPVRPLSPNRPLINAAGAVLGLLLGLALVALLELRDSSFRTESEVANLLELPVLAQIPLVDTPGDLRARRPRKLLSAAALMAAFGTGGYVFWIMKLWRYVA